MISKWRWAVAQVLQQLWVRALISAFLGVATAMVAPVVAPFIPESLAVKLGAGAVEQVLVILASSLLSVTTFSLGIMVTAFSFASGSVTPRATALLQEDQTAQKVISTFLGGFIFSLVCVIGLKAGYYSDSGRLVLFAATIILVILIVIAMLRWIQHLTRFGLRSDTHDRVEAAAVEAMTRRMQHPTLGGHAGLEAPPLGAAVVTAGTIGYIRFIDVTALQSIAEKAGLRVHLAELPGAFVHEASPLLHVEGGAASDTLRAAFGIGTERTFEQDPRFGLCVLSEIAERALSPAVNDPGSAIDILSRLVRVLSICGKGAQGALDCPRVWVPRLSVDDMFDDAFSAIARDGAGNVGVQIRLQKALAALVAMDGATFSAAAAHQSAQALQRAEAHLLPFEAEALRAAMS